MKQYNLNLMEQKVFRIKVRPPKDGQQHLIKYIQKDQHLLKLISYQFATKYLQSIGVQCTKANVAMILKQYPLKQCCKIQESGLNQFQSDTITVTLLKNKGKQVILQKSLQKQERRKKQHMKIVGTQLGIDFDNFFHLMDKFQKPKYSQSQQIKKIDKDRFLGRLNKQKLPIVSQKGYKQQEQKLKKTNNSLKKGKYQFVYGNKSKQNQQKNQQPKGQEKMNKVGKKQQAQKIKKTRFNTIKKSKEQEVKDKLQKIFKAKNYYKNQPKKNLLNTDQKNKQGDKQQTLKLYLDFEIQKIMQKYLFPFNQNFQKKANLFLKDQDSQKIKIYKDDKNNMLYLKIYQFPFSQVKLQPQSIRSLQIPITINVTTIIQFLKEFSNKFPKQYIPIAKVSSSSQYVKSNQIQFKIQQINQIFQLISSQHNARLIGLLSHLSYWVVLGKVNPIQIDFITKKQMFLMIWQIIQYFDLKMNKKRKLWISLGLPILILSFKMLTQVIFKQTYKYFFQEFAASPMSPGNIALAKIFFLIQNIFDPNNLFSRLVFLQSGTGAVQTMNLNRNSIFDRKFLRKRIYATSPILNFLLPNPRDGKARSIIAKKEYFDLKEGIKNLDQYQIQQQVHSQQNNQMRMAQKQAKMKLFDVLLKKMYSKLKIKLGKNNILNINP